MLLCLSANHSNASFGLLEKLSINTADVANQLSGTAFVSGAVVVATCNRFEAYLDIDEALTVSAAGTAETANAALDVVSAASRLPVEDLRKAMTILDGADAVEHLFAVSSGLESVVVGEDEISGQVRRALERARLNKTTSSELERLFQSAARTARGVKTGTALGGAGRSLVRLALELASSRIVNWTTTRVLIVGTGQYAGTTVAALRHHGVADLHVFSPSGRGTKFALRHGLMMQESLAIAIATVDVVITCTSSAEPVITPEIVAGSSLAALTRDARPADMRRLGSSGVHTDAHTQPRGSRTKLLIDLGMPRNIDPLVADVAGIELLDLETVSLHAPIEELNATRDARELVDAAALEFAAGSAERALTSGIVALRTHVFELLEAEIARTRSRSGGGSTAQAEAALRHLVGVLLHTPSMRARELARNGDHQEFIAGLDALFGIQPGDDVRFSVPPEIDAIDADLPAEIA